MAVNTSAYLRLETDDEFIIRVFGSLINVARTGAVLDDHIWSLYRKQRRIIEVYP